MSARELAGRVAIVTGGASGLGVAYCRGLSEAGAKVVRHFGKQRCHHDCSSL